ncbi:DUF1501 domain-containing protein [Litorimonas sp. RW-G-Af-16]|uniref:DUF1501 domain-containing protein n=1 Tax=Litorimonas sp. RW-G-Af-16 TaxID=3241168 RepID=UPI00390C84E8
MISRRIFTASALAGLGITALPQLSFAKAETDRRFVLIILRGAMDGLHALVPYADADYYKLRPTLSLGALGRADGGERPAIALNSSFALHPALAALKPLYDAKELALIPAISSQYRRRSHFEAQNMLEGGGAQPYAQKTGWLNRAIAQINQSERIGLALGPNVPLILQGSAPIRSWSDSRLPELGEDFLFRMDKMFENDPLFHKAFAQAQMDKEMGSDMSGMRLRNNRLSPSTKAACNLLKEVNGPRIAVIEAGGWDTHYGQTRRLTQNFEQLATAVTSMKTDLGPLWAKTSVMIVSEFGRTAAENGSGGTDHGTGGLAIVAGGTVNGGQVLGDWPGLSPTALFEDRDLAPSNQLESLFAAALTQHLGLSDAKVFDHVFPDLKQIRQPASDMAGLFKA